MISFIHKIAVDVKDLPPRETLVIFPTQRACREFRMELAKLKSGVDWMPTVLPIRDLLSKLEAPSVADDLTLLLELWDVYRNLFGEEEFESFMAYGQQIIDDFNEIDRQNIDAAHLFEEIKDLKVLESRFAPGDEEYEFVKSFWSEFLRTPLTPLQDSFLGYWKQLPLLYSNFREALKSKGIAYEGMSWRVVADTMSEQPFFKKWKKIVFAGFYALNTTEERIFEWLDSRKQLILFRDADALYADNSLHEAGMFFRRGKMADEKIGWKENHLSVPKKSYIVKGCNGRFSIARELVVTLLDDLKEEAAGGLKQSRIVVLADESLLYPFLHHCQLAGLSINASMGFPLKHHPLFHLLQTIKTCNRYSSAELSESIMLRHLKDFCEEPLLRRVYSPEQLGETSREDTTISLSSYDAGLIKLLFPQDKEISIVKSGLYRFLHSIPFEKDEWMYEVHLHALHAVEAAFEILSLHEDQISLTVWWQLFLEHLQVQRIPFLSDRENGIPVVGFLETRILDYDTVYIAPLNEGTLPGDAISKSLIPYSLRKAYHLPCKEEQDAVTAYHFYRLLQRAEHIRFLYNTDLNATGGGERSRYLFQIDQDILRYYPPETLIYQQQEATVKPNDAIPIIIEKTENVLQLLKKKFCGPSDETNLFKGLSASALNTYISCPLRFYLDQIAGIRPDDEQEGLSSGHFGNVLHKSMELAYEEKGVIKPDYIKELPGKIPALVEQAIREAYGKPVNTGHDFLMKGVLTELVKRIIEFDLDNSPFEIIGLEEKLTSAIELPGAGVVLLKGIIDRLDIFKGELRILDYKTGRDVVKEAEDIQLLFTDPVYKLNLQLLLYVMLTRDYYPDMEFPVKAGIFKMRQFDEGITWLQEELPVTDDQIQEFREGLIVLVTEMFNPDKPFIQTTEPERCRFCDYKGLCGRLSS